MIIEIQCNGGQLHTHELQKGKNMFRKFLKVLTVVTLMALQIISCRAMVPDEWEAHHKRMGHKWTTYVLEKHTPNKNGHSAHSISNIQRGNYRWNMHQDPMGVERCSKCDGDWNPNYHPKKTKK